MKDPVKLTFKKFGKIGPTDETSASAFGSYRCIYEVQDEKNVSYVKVTVGGLLATNKELDEKTAEQVAFWFVLEDAKKEIQNGNLARGEQFNPVPIICNEPNIGPLPERDKKIQEWINTPIPKMPYTEEFDIPPDKIGFTSQKRK